MAHNPARLVCGLGFDVVLGGKLQDPRRGDDLRFGRPQDRILAGCLPALTGVAEVARNRVFAGPLRLRVFVHLAAECLVPRGLVADPGGRHGEVPVWGWMQLFALGVAGGSWFGGTQRLDLLAGAPTA